MHIEVHHLLQYMLWGCDKSAVYSGLVLFLLCFFHPMAYHCGSFGYVLKFVPRRFSCNGPRKTYRTHIFWNTVQKQKITMQVKPQLWNRHGGRNQNYRASLLKDYENSMKTHWNVFPVFFSTASSKKLSSSSAQNESLQRFEFQMIHELPSGNLT